jgi:hypothetical protein
MITNKCSERPRWITMTVPVLHHQIRTPKKISKLIYQMNLRGFKTGKITWGDPIIIEMSSHENFIEHVKKGRRTGKREIDDFYQFLIHEVDFKMNIHPFIAVAHEPVIVSLVLKHSQIKKFEKLFYEAFIKHHHSEKKFIRKYETQELDEQQSED